MNTRTITKLLVGQYGKGSLLDVGAGYGRYRDMLSSYVDTYQSSDAVDTRADFVEDSAHLSHADNTFDTVLCNQTLEHVAEADQSIRELHRVLKSGGYAIATVPFLFPEHEDPMDFRRYTRDGFAKAFRDAGFAVVECKSYNGLASVIAEFIRMRTRNPYLPPRSAIVRKLGYWSSQFFDRIDARRKDQTSDVDIFYSSLYIVAKK